MIPDAPNQEHSPSDLARPAKPAPGTTVTVTTIARRPPVPTWCLTAFLMVVTLGLYWPAVHYGFVNFDDPLYVTENPRVLAGLGWNNWAWAFTTTVAANWHPLTLLSLMLDVNVFGTRPAGFHFTNLVIHAVNAGLVFALLQRLSGARWRSFGAAALFAWHPLHVESVAWVSERKDVLSACLGLLALLYYVKYAQAARVPDPKSSQSSSLYYGLSLGLFALGLMSKPMLVTWPFVMCLLDYWPLERFRKDCWRPLVREKLPFLGLALVASVVACLVQQSDGVMVDAIQEPIDMRFGNALISYLRYLIKLFWPVDLAVFYPHPGYWPLPQVLLAGGMLVALSGFFWVERRRHPSLLMGWLWFLGTLVPVIGLIQVGAQSLADRYTYLPSVGVLIMVFWGAEEISHRRPWLMQAVAVALVAAILGCLAVTRCQLRYWRNSETLFRHALAVTRDNYVAHNNLGTALADRNTAEADAEALHEYQTALRLRPDNPMYHYNLASSLIKQGALGSAIEQFQAAIRLKSDYTDAHYNLGLALATQGQMYEAIREFQTAIRLRPDFINAHNNLGAALAESGRYDEAIHEFQEVLRLQPDYPRAQSNLAKAMALKNQPKSLLSAPAPP